MALVAALLAACESPPEDACAQRPGEASLEIECGPTSGESWSRDAVDEAEEGFEERGPGGRR
jgi:hypothetical protein